MTDFKFDPRRTALINVDMQNCFVEKFATCGAARPRDFAAHQHGGDAEHK